MKLKRLAAPAAFVLAAAALAGSQPPSDVCSRLPPEQVQRELRIRTVRNLALAEPLAAEALAELRARPDALRRYPRRQLVEQLERRDDPIAAVEMPVLNRELTIRSDSVAEIPASELRQLMSSSIATTAAASVALPTGQMVAVRTVQRELERRSPLLSEFTRQQLQEERVRRASPLTAVPADSIRAEMSRRAGPVGDLDQTELETRIRRLDPYATAAPLSMTDLWEQTAAVSCSDATLVDRQRAIQGRVFGEDTRIGGPDLRSEIERLKALPNPTADDVTRAETLTVALTQLPSVALIANKRHLSDVSGTPTLRLSLAAGTAVSVPPLCSTERFAGEHIVSPPPTCSGFLIRRDAIVTALHCLNEIPLQDMRIVFDYHNDGQAVSGDTVFTAAGPPIVPADAGEDWAVLTLDRPTAREPLPLASGAPTAGTPLYVIGHPLGLSIKVAASGTLTRPRRDDDERHFLYGTITSFGGNSGSPVFDRAQHKVIGFVHAGRGNDFTTFPTTENGQSCSKTFICRGLLDCSSSEIGRATFIKPPNGP